MEAVHAAKNAVSVSPKTEIEELLGIDLSSDFPSFSDGGGGKISRHLALIYYITKAIFS